MRNLFRKDKTLSYNNIKSMPYTDFINSENVNLAKSLINSAENLFYNIETNSPALHVKLEDEKFIILTDLPLNVFSLIKGLLISKDFIIRRKGAFLEIFSKNNHNSSYLFLEDKNILLNDFFDDTKNISCVVSDRINLPIYVGNNSVIERLIETSDYRYKTLNLGEVLYNE